MRTLPQLKDITLEQWVNFYLLYGKELDRRYNAILSMPESEEKDDMYMLYEVESAQQTYSFYTSVFLDEVEMIDVKDLLINNSIAFVGWNNDTINAMANISSGVEWNGEYWQLQPIGKDADKTSFAEFEHTQEVSLLFADLEDGKVEQIYKLFSIFFRRVDESLTDIKRERVELMKELPLDIAYAIKEALIDANRK